MKAVGRRRGAAIIEVALTLPILVLICLATIDTCRVIYLRQSAKIVAFECARIGIIPGVKQVHVDSTSQSLLKNRGIHGWSLSLNPPLTELHKGDLLTVCIAVPANENSLGTSWFYRGKTFRESVSILVEH